MSLTWQFPTTHFGAASYLKSWTSVRTTLHPNTSHHLIHIPNTCCNTLHVVDFGCSITPAWPCWLVDVCSNASPCRQHAYPTVGGSAPLVTILSKGSLSFLHTWRCPDQVSEHSFRHIMQGCCTQSNSGCHMFLCSNFESKYAFWSSHAFQ